MGVNRGSQELLHCVHRETRGPEAPVYYSSWKHVKQSKLWPFPRGKLPTSWPWMGGLKSLVGKTTCKDLEAVMPHKYLIPKMCRVSTTVWGRGNKHLSVTKIPLIIKPVTTSCLPTVYCLGTAIETSHLFSIRIALSSRLRFFLKKDEQRRYLPDANALVDSAESFKNEKAGILDEVLKASNQEEVIHQNLKMQSIFHQAIKRNFANFTVIGFK